MSGNGKRTPAGSAILAWGLVWGAAEASVALDARLLDFDFLG